MIRNHISSTWRGPLTVGFFQCYRHMPCPLPVDTSCAEKNEIEGDTKNSVRIRTHARLLQNTLLGVSIADDLCMGPSFRAHLQSLHKLSFRSFFYSLLRLLSIFIFSILNSMKTRVIDPFHFYSRHHFIVGEVSGFFYRFRACFVPLKYLQHW